MALADALRDGPVVGLYIATPAQWESHDDAPIKLDFWRRNLAELDTALADKGIPLVYCLVREYAAIPGLMKEIVRKWKPERVCFNAEYPLNEHRRDAQVTSLLEQAGVRVDIFHDQVLMQPGTVLNNSGQPFRVFTPFARRCRSLVQVPAQSYRNVVATNRPDVLPILDNQCRLQDINWPTPVPSWATLWPSGENHAQRVLESFCREGIGNYQRLRDIPSIDGTSKLSVFLNAGVLSIRDCWRHATSATPGDGPETWKNELLWREFYKHVMFHFPRVSMGRPFKDDLGHVPWRHDKEDFRRWCEGMTGIPIVDAGMRQLRATGWMHNRLRMITAMFLAKHLLIDWRWGESWFMQHLVDGDFSANNGGWQWSSSTGTDAVPYFRIFNPVTQSRRFDPEGSFIKQYLPELSSLNAGDIHNPGMKKPDNYPEPLVDLKFGRQRALAAFRTKS